MAVSVRDYAYEHPGADFQSIVKRFGTPKQVIATYMHEMDSSELLDAMRIRNSVLKAISIVAVVTVAIWLFAAGIVAYIGAQDVNGTIETYIDVYENNVDGEVN